MAKNKNKNKRNSLTPDFVFDNDQNTVLYKNETFVYQNTLRDCVVFKCQIQNCVARVKVNKGKTKILTGTPTHTFHNRQGTPNSKVVTESKTNNVSSPTHNIKQSALPASPCVITKSTSSGNKIQDTSSLSINIGQSNIAKSNPQNNKESKKDKSMHQTQDAHIPLSYSDQLKQNLPRTSLPIPAIPANVPTPNIVTQASNNDEVLQLTLKLSARESEIVQLKEKVEILEQLLSRYQTDNKPDSALPQTNNDSNFTCHILGDSHVRGLRDIFTGLLPADCNVQASFHPGAGFHEIAATHIQSPNFVKTSPNDRVILICGTNDVCSTQWEIVKKALDVLLNKFQTCLKTYVVGVPHRYNDKKINYHIDKFNTKIKFYLQSKLSNSAFIDPRKLINNKDYAADGLHLSKAGKIKFCKKLGKRIILSPAVPEPSNQQCTQKTEHPVNNNNKSLQVELIDLENCNDDLIDFDNLDSTFFFKPATRNETEIFPESDCSFITTTLHNGSTHHDTDHTHVSLLDTPIPQHVNSLINKGHQNAPNYYRLAHISNGSFSTAFHSSPIPTTSHGHGQSANMSNFPDLGQTRTT